MARPIERIIAQRMVNDVDGGSKWMAGANYRNICLTRCCEGGLG